MNLKIASALYGYFETMYIMNQRLIQLCGYNIMACDELPTKVLLDIIQDLPRVIPYEWSHREQKLVLSTKNGLLEFQDDLPYLRNSYEDILSKHYDFLDIVRKIRNKYEHRMHDIDWLGTVGSPFSFFDVQFNVNGDYFNVHGLELIALVKDLNILFSTLSTDVQKCANATNLASYPYNQKLSRFDYVDFNEIYGSPLLPKIGNILYPF